MANLITDDPIALTWVGARGCVSVKTFKTHADLARFAVNELSLVELKKFESALRKHIGEIQRQSDAVRKWRFSIPNTDNEQT